ncbi:hypothetical protein B0H66DRAFT_538534 [Apodospora peruviana]|uniref:Uncharacterized protein n=1 Tax=Apodospora peruviana TaxID=516989 RepID=A0AAE0HST7_9PEZI|nr:hypothetical protein B0H66DRAFT_538534 [Apodospora peruviana]
MLEKKKRKKNKKEAEKKRKKKEEEKKRKKKKKEEEKKRKKKKEEEKKKRKKRKILVHWVFRSGSQGEEREVKKNHPPRIQSLEDRCSQGRQHAGADCVQSILSSARQAPPGRG